MAAVCSFSRSPFFFAFDSMLRDLAGKLVDQGYGLLDVALASYNHLMEEDLPRMINELRRNHVYERDFSPTDHMVRTWNGDRP